MRVVVRIAVVLSAVVVLGMILLVVSALSELNEWRDEPRDDTFLFGVLFGALYSLIPLAFIWLGVFVIYVLAQARRMRSG